MYWHKNTSRKTDILIFFIYLNSSNPYSIDTNPLCLTDEFFGFAGTLDLINDAVNLYCVDNLLSWTFYFKIIALPCSGVMLKDIVYQYRIFFFHTTMAKIVLDLKLINLAFPNLWTGFHFMLQHKKNEDITHACFTYKFSFFFWKCQPTSTINLDSNVDSHYG